MKTAEQFEREYASRAGASVEELRDRGRIVRPCFCGDESCEGWQSVNKDSYDPLPGRDPEWDAARGGK